ncbi:coproporphyrinogen dehydrogenase HemZ [Pectinatus sottacetonis]|uniref:coproporphyrinogen dehydrogenase HemZ n=1 Tax=Pectinatus sottacetonis TaxID=1002795 RepID=UPI0018C5C523|nr:coproporphyrinogen dehydrogenase HemZ [Pectinatus sottacetonis]
MSKTEIKKIIVNSKKEVIHKIVREILVLFQINTADEIVDIYDFDSLEISNSIVDGSCLSVTTSILLKNDKLSKNMEKTSLADIDENPRAAVNRLIKWNLYYLFTEVFGKTTAPWGILHGVRPTKIVHRYIERGLHKSEIIRKLIDNYAVVREKALLLADIAYRQLPIMATTDQSTISIYIGIPFCLSRCLYCSFPSNILPDNNTLKIFMDTLYQEIVSIKKIIEQYKLKVQAIYIGGGTPTSLPEEEFYNLLCAVNNLKTRETIEFTVEAGRPDSITAAKITAMEQFKVTRISVNPQTMQEKTLQVIGRKHTPADIITVYNKIRAVSRAKINMDLILGLPGESVEDVRDTLNKVTALNPDDITVHALAIKKGSYLKLHQSDINLPSDPVVCQMAEITQLILQKNSYIPYYLYRQGYMSGQLENIGYCKKDAASIYNIQIMSERQTILGIGGNASTKIVAPSGTYLKTLFNPKDLKTYLENADKYIRKRASLMEEVYGK